MASKKSIAGEADRVDVGDVVRVETPGRSRQSRAGSEGGNLLRLRRAVEEPLFDFLNEEWQVGLLKTGTRGWLTVVFDIW